MAEDEKELEQEDEEQEKPEKRQGKGNRRKAKADRRKELGPREEVAASQLDESVHAEAILLFRNSADSTVLAKQMQWKTVGSTLILFLTLVALGKFVSAAPGYIATLKIIVIVAGTTAFLMLGIYQFWQHTEAKKMASVARDFSSLWREVRAIKSITEANFHRYLLLLIMFTAITVGGFVTVASLNRLTPLG